MQNDVSYIIVINPIDIIYLKMYYHTYKCYTVYLSEFIGDYNMEQDLNKYIVNEFCKLQTDTEQRSFIENFRFLMMSNDFDFENYYSNKALRRTDFYSITDMLYQLNNFWMSSYRKQI